MCVLKGWHPTCLFSRLGNNYHCYSIEFYTWELYLKNIFIKNKDNFFILLNSWLLNPLFFQFLIIDKYVHSFNWWILVFKRKQKWNS